MEELQGLPTRYEVLEGLGQGGSANVYLVRDRQLGEKLALKVLRALVEAERSSLLNEFQVLSRLQLEGIASVRDFGVLVGSGLPFFTREYVQGQSLLDWSARSAQSDRMRVVLDVLDVVARLHAIGVIHGDIKPQNALVDENGDVHVIDFGMASVVGRDHIETGATLAYAAPEILRGGRPTERSDVFASAAMAWHVLERSPPPREARERAQQAQTNAVLKTLKRALEDDPDARISSVRELAYALSASAPELDWRATPLPWRVSVPRTHNDTLHRLHDALATSLRVAGPERVANFLLSGPGAGKSTMLERLKWRLQLAGNNVVEATGELPDDVVEYLVSDPREERLVIIVDDAHLTPTPQLVRLRDALVENSGKIALLLAANQSAANRLRSIFSARNTYELAPLGVEDIEGSVQTILGSRASDVAESLIKHSDGRFDRLMQLLRALDRESGVTKEDVSEAALRLESLSDDQSVRPSSGDLDRDARLLLAHQLLERGVYADCLALLPAELSDDRLEEKMLRASAHLESGDVSLALGLLQNPPDSLNEEEKEAWLRLQGRALVASRNFQGAIDLAEEHPDSVGLRLSRGVAQSMLGDAKGARESVLAALEDIRCSDSQQGLGDAHTCLAIVSQACGELDDAHENYQKALDIARAKADLGRIANASLNLGVLEHRLGVYTNALRDFRESVRFARRSGRVSTDLRAQTNLAHLLVFAGAYEEADRIVDRAAAMAEDAAARWAIAEINAVRAELAARTGDLELGLVRYREARLFYEEIEEVSSIVELLVLEAEALLDRGAGGDGSAAASRLGEARRLAEKSDHEMHLELELQSLRVLEPGDTTGVMGKVEAFVERARRSTNQPVLWKALWLLAHHQATSGASYLARQSEQEAMMVLESIATRLPRAYRESFWNDPRRGAVRQRVSSKQSASHAESRFGDERVTRLLDMIKRLASERNLDRLLERITDAAVDLSGAERGFVLMVDEQGKLMPRTVREGGQSADAQAHVMFSNSIAESVLIDGQPIVTVDARDDARISEFMSVHKLMLKSVACMPIRGRSGTLGVLYLEHRMRRGRFADTDLDLLFALADQAAIAIENARLIKENDERREALQRVNAELAEANARLELGLTEANYQLAETKRELRTILADTWSDLGLVGRSVAMQHVFHLIDRVSQSDVPVVIQGESGTGKELVARAVHQRSARQHEPFVAINCAAIPDNLLESELFGHVKGAFTGADRDRDGVFVQASGGILFLDEIGDMPLRMQVELLRVLQDGKVRPVGGGAEIQVDVRVLCASHRDLRQRIEEGAFREDLYYRLCVVEVRLPPLRERAGDVPILSEYFLRKIAAKDDVPKKRLSRDAVRQLERYDFPGNVRELEHILMRACVMTSGELIDELHLSTNARRSSLPPPAQAAVSREHVPESVDAHKDAEKQRILDALELVNWNRAQAARELGMARRTFYRRLRDYGILEPS